MEDSEFRLLVKHCFLMGKNIIQTEQWLEKCYGTSCPSKVKITRWFTEFEKERIDADDEDADTNDIEHSNDVKQFSVKE